MCDLKQSLNNRFGTAPRPLVLRGGVTVAERPSQSGPTWGMPASSPPPLLSLWTHLRHFAWPGVTLLAHITVFLKYRGKGSPLGGASPPPLPDLSPKGNGKKAMENIKPAKTPLPVLSRGDDAPRTSPAPHTHVKMNPPLPHARNQPRTAAPGPALLSWAAGGLQLLLCHAVTSCGNSLESARCTLLL